MKTTAVPSIRMIGFALMLTAIAALVPVSLHGDIKHGDIRTNLLVKNLKVTGYKERQVPKFSRAQVQAVKLTTGDTLAGSGVRITDERGREIILTAGMNFPLGRPSAPYSYNITGDTMLHSITERAQVTVPAVSGIDLPTGVVVLVPGQAKPLHNYWQGQSYNSHGVRVIPSPADLRSVRTGETIHSPMMFTTLGMTIRVIAIPTSPETMGEGFLDDEGRLYITFGSGGLRKEGKTIEAVFGLLWTGNAD